MKKNKPFRKSFSIYLKKTLLTMRIAIILMILGILQARASDAYSQKARISLNFTDAALVNVLDKIEEESEFFFMYNEKLLDTERKVTINEKDQFIDAILKNLFAGTDVNVTILDRKIILAPDYLTKEIEATQNIQQKAVTGKVIDAGGIPLPGVNVLLKGTLVGATTDAGGKYTLTIPDGNGILVFSFIGFTAQEIPVNGSSTINVTLVDDLKTLEEVVVIGYGTVKKSDLTGATSSVSASQLVKVPVTTLEQSLQGISAGVQVTNVDASPGAGINIRIRGTGTFGDNSPLYVVDGYPISGNISQLNTNDIATIDILKDASATAIYGNRASNGVVIITTKRGSKDGLQVVFDAQTSVQSQPKFFDVLNAEQFALAAQEVNKTQGFPILPEWNNPSSLRNIDWQDELYQTGIRQNYNIALRAGNDKVQTSLSLGYLKQRGIIIYSDYQRYNMGLTLDFVPVKWIKTSTNVKYSRNDRDVRFGTGMGQVGMLTRAIPTMTGNPLTDQVKDANGNYGFYTQANVQATIGSNNLVADIEGQENHNPSNDLLTTGSLEITFIEGLRFKSNIGVNVKNANGYSFSKSNTRSQAPTLASYTQRSSDTFEWLWENTLAYVKTIGIHSIDFVGGISSQENTYRMMNTTGTGLISDDLRNIGSLSSVSPTGNEQTWSLASQFGRLTYKILDRYIITGTVRRDGSSKFGPGKKWGVFPSLAFAWNIKDEPFMSNATFVNNFKFRGSWGKAGNQNIDLFQYQSTYGTGTSVRDNRGYVFGNSKVYQTGIALNGLENANLTWETTIQSNVGIDASFFNSQINFTADYYNRESSNFLLNVPVPAQTGFTTATRNVGSIRNSGIELSLGYRQSTKEFKWSVTGNISTVNNKILSFTEGLTSITNFAGISGWTTVGNNIWTTYSLSEVGGNIGSFYGFVTDGIYQQQAEVDAANTAARAIYGPTVYFQNTKTSPGDRKFVDLNGDGRITDADRRVIGTPIPKMFGGLNFDASYKNFDCSLSWYFSYGNGLFNYSKRNLQTFDRANGVGLQNISTEYYNNYWKTDRPSDTYTRLLAYDEVGNNRPSDAYVEDGSYVRLKNLQIGYTIPTSLANKIRVYVSGQNLMTITKYSGADPEIGDVGGVTGTGIDIGNYPTSRYYSLGLNVSF